MKVVYTAPTRGHHYHYATAMQEAGVLHRFVSGFSRLSPRAPLKAVGHNLHRADWLQTVYLASLKLQAPNGLSSHLAYLAKIEQDYACTRHINAADIFLFYSGSGLRTCRQAQRRGVITIVEAVNSHVSYQERILEDEYRRLGLPWTPFHASEKARRLREYEQADYILTPSDFVRQSFLEQGFSADKLLKVPYGFNALTVNPAQPDPTTFTILYVGSISVRKGIRYLIQAFDRLRHPRKKLVIVGPRTAPDGLHNLTIPDNVIFTGSLKDNDLIRAYQSADVFCLPTLEEGFGLVLGEALSFGLPIVTTTNSGGTELIRDGQEGFIVPIGNVDSLHERLQQLADEPVLCQVMQEAACAKAYTIQGWQEAGNLLVGTLQTLLTPVASQAHGKQRY